MEPSYNVCEVNKVQDTERYINGYDIKNWFQLGLGELEADKKKLNAINVFPVADGDTGTNMASTVRAMAEKPTVNASFGRMFSSISEIGLAYARGNSGIIFASYINGIAIESKPFEEVNLKEFAHIAKDAVAYVYKAIENPVEGTMISVIRDWANFLFDNHHKYKSFQELFHHAFEIAMQSLESTTEKIAVLRKHNFVDSGALGFVGFLKGINVFFSERNLDFANGKMQQVEADEVTETDLLPVEKIDHQDLKYRYCTEFIVERHLDREKVFSELSQMGDSLIVLCQEKQTKIHLHTNTPDEAIWKFRGVGNITNQEIDDMLFTRAQQSRKLSPIGIVTDSISDLPAEFVLDNLIKVIPLSLMIAGDTFLDKLSIKPKQLFQYLQSNRGKNNLDYPSSSLPEPIRVRNIFENMLESYESIIAISVSSKLSGTYNCMMSAVSMLQEQGNRKKITIIDSKLNAGAQGLLVQQATKLVGLGLGHEEIVEEIEKLREKIRIYVCLETVDNAVRSGRVPNTIGKIVRMLGARPIMTLNSLGEGAAFGVGFSKEGITKRIMQLVERTNREQGITSYNIIHSDNEALAAEYGEQLTQIIGIKPDYITEISAITSLYSGQGCVAVSFITK
jgi:hypothetical protein